ncbi:MAG: NUDIX domain-containing protein [Nanoarchaeota archaeon]|nr:NUDIX domain-containing protein [Nanoarchaeota archaeon]
MIKYRKGVGSLIFRRTPDGLKFLIFHRIRNWKGWELLKGGLLDGESFSKGLRREMKEETGFKKYKIHPKCYTIKFKWSRNYVKDHHKFHGAQHRFVLIETTIEKIKLDRYEHDKYRWVTRGEALKLLTHDNHKSILRKLTRGLK